MVAAVVARHQGDTRPAMNVPRRVLDSFERLVEGDEKARTAAAMVILQHVDQILRGGVQGKELPAGVRYIMQRLVSGLASSRLCAREGYFSTLCFLLRLHPTSFKPTIILSLLTSKKSASMKVFTKDELREQLVAELLLCGAIVRSGQVRRSPEVLQCVVNQLCAMRSKKSYMDITATQFLVSLMEGCEGDIMHEEVWQSLQSELQGPMTEMSPSQLWLRLVLLRKHCKEPPVWLTSTLAPNNHKALGQTVMKAVIGLPEVHPVLPELVSNLAASSSSLLVKFWGVTLEPLQGHASPGKLQILFHLLRFILPHLRTAAEIKAVFTSTVVGLLLNSLTQPLRDLKEAAKGVTAALVQLVKDNQTEDSDLQLAVVHALVTPPGSVRFDQLAGHKVLAVMTPSLTLRTLKGMANILLEVLKKPKVAKDSLLADRSCAAHTLGNLLSQPRAFAEEAAKWRVQQLAALLKAALFTPRKEEEREGDTIKDAFFKALRKQVGHIKEYKDNLLNLVEEAEKELKAGDKTSPSGDSSSSPLNKKGREQWSKVYSRLALLQKKEYRDTEQDVAKTIFQVLYSQMALHLFVDVTVATDTTEELITCHKEVKKLGMLNNDEEEEEDDEEEEDGSVEGKPNWVELVTEMLLSLMTQEMHIFRSVVQSLFWLLTPLVTATALSLLTDVLDSEKARELLKKEGEEESEEEDEDEEEDENEEEEDEDENEERKKEGSDGDDSDTSDEEEEEPADDDDPNLFTLRKKMIEAAGGIDVDVDLDSVPQEELDRLDERMGALLAEYRGKHPGKKRRKRKGKGGGGGGSDGPQLTEDELSLMHFQTRVCDMLTVYIKAAPNMTLQVGLVLPIFKALRMADQDPRLKDLQNKLANVIGGLEKKKKFNTFGDITLDSWKETVSDFFSLALQMPEKFGSVIQSCYSLLMHCGRLLLGQTEGALTKPDNLLTLTYVSHLKTFFTVNHYLPKVQPFIEPCTYTIGGLWQVAATLVHAAFDSSVKVHKQSQAVRTLQYLYTNKALVADRSGTEAAILEQDLCTKVIKTLESMQPPINGFYGSLLFRFLNYLLQVDRRTEPEPNLNWSAVHERLEAFRERISKADLKAFRHEYNVFSKALEGLLTSKKRQKQVGVKRLAEEIINNGSQEGQAKKRKKENKANSSNLVKYNGVPDGEDEQDKKNKNKKKKNKQISSEEEVSKGKDTKEINTQKSEIMTKEEDSSEPEEVMVISGSDNEIQYLGEVNTEETKMQKKDVKQDKLTTTATNTKESTNTANQVDAPEKKKKKKKKKDKPTDTSTISTASSSDSPQKEDHPSKESKKKKRKDKLSDAVIVLTGSKSNSEEIQCIQSDQRIDEVTLTKKKKKKKDSLPEKRKQEDDEEEKTENGEEKGLVQSIPSSSTLTLDSPSKKKKKKKKTHTEQQEGSV